MDTNLTETLETQPSPSDSLDFDPNPVNSWPNSPSHDQTLGDPSNSSSVTAELGLEDFTNELSHSRDGNPNPSVSVQFLDAESQEEEEQGYYYICYYYYYICYHFHYYMFLLLILILGHNSYEMHYQRF